MLNSARSLLFQLQGTVSCQSQNSFIISHVSFVCVPLRWVVLCHASLQYAPIGIQQHLNQQLLRNLRLFAYIVSKVTQFSSNHTLTVLTNNIVLELWSAITLTKPENFQIFFKSFEVKPFFLITFASVSIFLRMYKCQIKHFSPADLICPLYRPQLLHFSTSTLAIFGGHGSFTQHALTVGCTVGASYHRSLLNTNLVVYKQFTCTDIGLVLRQPTCQKK